MRIILVGGEPATGKTTLFENMMPEGRKMYKLKSMVYTVFEKEKFLYAGIYKGGRFDGTDRLSMSVQPDFERSLYFVRRHFSSHTLFIEGDRLVNKKTLDFIKNLYHKLYILESSKTKERHILRGDNQTEKFLKGRKTKYENIKKNYPHTVLVNDTEGDMKKNMEILKNEILWQQGGVGGN